MMERLSSLLRKSGEWIAPIAAVSMVFVMLVPLPSFMLDLLLTLSITASILVLPARAAFCFMAMKARGQRAR